MMRKKASELPDFFAPGDSFAGCYQIETLLGKGTFGQVYRAWDHLQGCEVAVKISHDTDLQKEGDLLHVLAPLIKVPQPFDAGCTQGYWFLAMEYIDGATLRELIDAYREEGRCMSVKDVLTIAIELLSSLTIMHDRQHPIMQCDLNPGNILLGTNGKVYLVDFGIARHDPAWHPPKKGDKIPGTFPYVSPEYVNQHYISPRADIYALGVVIYELLTGEIPTVCTCTQLVCQKKSHQFKKLRGPLGNLVMQMIHPQFKHRPAGAKSLKLVFEQLLAQRQKWNLGSLAYKCFAAIARQWNFF